MLLDEILTIQSDNTSKTEMKKSVFIAHLFRVESEDEAKLKIEEIRKEYKDATHNVPAYRIYDTSSDMIIERCSDDGEPSGTSGKPILDLLKHKGLLNTLIIVTRYFGGTLLGTGGLVKAYTDSAKEVLNVPYITLKRKIKYDVKTDYENFNRIKKRFEDSNFKLENINYNLDVNFELFISGIETDRHENVLESIISEFSNNIIIKKIQTCYKD